MKVSRVMASLDALNCGDGGVMVMDDGVSSVELGCGAAFVFDMDIM